MESLIRKCMDLVCRTHKNALSKFDDDVNLDDLWDLDDLWEHISELWKLREKENHGKERRHYGWPNNPAWKDLNSIMIRDIDADIDAVKSILTRVKVAIVAPFVVAFTLEMETSNRGDEVWDLTEMMYDLAILLKRLSESLGRMQDVIQEATSLIVKGANDAFFDEDRYDTIRMTRELHAMYLHIITQFTACVFTPMPHPWRSHLSEKYRTHAEEVNHDELWEHIFKLWELREEGNHEEARSLGHFPWPNVRGLQDLKGIVLLGADDIHEHVKTILRRVNVASVAPLLVAHTLETLDASITNTEELWHLIEVMYDLAIVLEELSESSGGRTREVMQEATSLIVKGARVFSFQGNPRSV